MLRQILIHGRLSNPRCLQMLQPTARSLNLILLDIGFPTLFALLAPASHRRFARTSLSTITARSRALGSLGSPPAHTQGSRGGVTALWNSGLLREKLRMFGARG